MTAARKFGSVFNAAVWGGIDPYVDYSGKLDGLEILQISEAVLFDFLWYPQTENGKSFNDRCKIQIEKAFEALIDYFKDDPESPIYRIIKKHERRYRLLARNKEPKFYSVALTRMFFHIYEANWHLNEPDQIGGFLKRYL